MKFSPSALALVLTAPTATAQLLQDGKGLFSYVPDADNGPALWPTLDTSPDANACDGLKNSPIAFTAFQECDIDNAPYEFNAGDCPLDSFDFFNNDHSVEAAWPEDGSCSPASFSMPGIDGVYEIEQIHIHVGSEHVLEGNFADFELHGVHNIKSGSGNQDVTNLTNSQAVFGLWIQASGTEDNTKFQPLIDGWKAFHDGILASDACMASSNSTDDTSRSLVGGRGLEDGTFNVYDLVPDNMEYFFHYDGSLTTPPCTELIWWNVANRPMIISESQGEELRYLILDYRNATTCERATGANPENNFTSRDVQDLNGRTVRNYCTGSAEGGGETMTSGTVSSMIGAGVFAVMAAVQALM